MTTHTTAEPTQGTPLSLEEQRIAEAVKYIGDCISTCNCPSGSFCEQYGCDTLRQIRRLLLGELDGVKAE